MALQLLDLDKRAVAVGISLRPVLMYSSKQPTPCNEQLVGNSPRAKFGVLKDQSYKLYLGQYHAC